MKWIYIFVFFISLSANAWVINDCGVFEFEGRLIKEKGKYKLILSERFESQIDINIEILDKSRQVDSEMWDLDYVDKNISASIEIERKCDFVCKGKLHKVIDIIEPTILELKDPFSPYVGPTVSKRCKNE